MRRIAAILLSAAVLMSFFSVFASAEYNSELKGKLYSPIYMLVSLDDSTEIFNNGGNIKSAPATFVKIITAITVIENCTDIDAPVTVQQEALDIVKYNYGMVTSELSAGEVLTVRQLLYCCMLQSANDASNALAWYISGGKIDTFIGLMNDTVKNIGCDSTKLVNATGVDADGQYTTASDMVKIIKYGLKLPVFNEVFCAKNVKIPATAKHGERNYSTGNKMVFSSVPEYYYEYVTGGKAGATDNAGYVFAATAARDGYSYLAIVMKGERKPVTQGGDKKNCAILDAKTMIKWAFNNIRFKTVASTSQVISVIDVRAGKSADCVSLVPASDISALVPAKADYTSVLIEPVEGTLPERLTAPVKKGEILGQANVLYAGKKIAQVDLVAADTVERSAARYTGLIVKSVVGSVFFKVAFSLVVIALAGYVALAVAANVKHKKKRLKIVKK